MEIIANHVPKEMKDEVVRVGGFVDFDDDLDMFTATFYHHELINNSCQVKITDDLTGRKMILNRFDFDTIEIS